MTRAWLLLLFAILSCITALAVEVPMKTVVDVVPPGTTVAVIDIDDPSSIPEPLKAVVATIPPGSFLLGNEMDKPITVVVVDWKYNDSKGAERTVGIRCDGYLGSPYGIVVPAHSSSLVTPLGYAGEDSFAKLAAGKVIGSPLETPRSESPTRGISVTLHIIVDSVIFSDGEIRGPDAHAYYREIQDRYAGIQGLVQELLAAKSAGTPVAKKLDEIAQETPPRGDRRAAARRNWAHSLKNSPNIDGTLTFLRGQTIPSEFYHYKGGGE